MIRFGTNPIAWSNDDDRTLGGDIPLDTCLTQAGEIGFDGIEMGHKFPTEPAALKAALEPHGLALASGWYSLSLLTRSAEEEIAALTPHLELLKAMGSTVLIASETSNSIHGDAGKSLNDRPVLPAADWPEFGAKLTQVADHCAAEGVPLVYHHHMGTIVQTPEEIDRLMAETGPSVGLLFDTGHCYFGGGEPSEVLTRHVGRLGHLHLKNVRPKVMQAARMQGLSFLDAVKRGVFTVPGDAEGGVNFPPVLGLAASSGYDGWLVIEAEQDPGQRNPREYQSLGLKTLKDMAQTAGLATPQPA